MSAVETDRNDGYAVVRLNRPSSLNALNVPLIEELVEALRAVGDEPVVVLEAAGRAFCAGEDLVETLTPKASGADELHRSLRLVQEVTRLLSCVPMVSVAAVQGYAIGGGAELALSADLIVAQPDARFRFPEVSLGHSATGGITARLGAAIGLVRAKEILLRSRWVEADEALHIGLVSEIADDASLRARELAAELTAQPPRSLAGVKQQVERSTIPHFEAVLAAESHVALHCFADPRAQQSIDDFKP